MPRTGTSAVAEMPRHAAHWNTPPWLRCPGTPRPTSAVDRLRHDLILDKRRAKVDVAHREPRGGGGRTDGRPRRGRPRAQRSEYYSVRGGGGRGDRIPAGHKVPSGGRYERVGGVAGSVQSGGHEARLLTRRRGNQGRFHASVVQPPFRLDAEAVVADRRRVRGAYAELR